MKRFFNQLKQKYKKKSKLNRFQDAIIAIIGVLSIIVTIFISVNYFDTKPATEIDYQSLKKQAIAIEEDPTLLYEKEGTFKDGIITIIFENNECKLIVKYNQDFKIESIKKVDKCISILQACTDFITILMLLWILIFIVVIVLLIILGAIDLIVELIKEKKNK